MIFVVCEQEDDNEKKIFQKNEENDTESEKHKRRKSHKEWFKDC